MERGGRLERRTALARGEHRLKVDPEKVRAWQRRTARRLPLSSRRRAELRPARAAFVAEVLRLRPWCEAQLSWCCTGRSSEVNELQRGTHREDCWLNPDKVTSLCGPCHAWLTAHPDWAVRHGHQVEHNADPTAIVSAFAEAALVRCRLQPGATCLSDCSTDHRVPA